MLNKRLYLKSYHSFTEFRIWCLINNPYLLKSFINPFMSETEWKEYKEKFYNQNSYKNKDELLEECEVPIAEFDVKNAKYLLKYCPFDYIRKYLHRTFDYKEKWFYKFLFKH